MTPEQIVADIAARIRDADEQSLLASRAFAASETTTLAYMQQQSDQILKQIEELNGGTDSATGDS